MGLFTVILCELSLLILRVEHSFPQYIRPTCRYTTYWLAVGFGMSAPHSWQVNHCIFHRARDLFGLLAGLRGSFGFVNRRLTHRLEHSLVQYIRPL